MRRLRRAIPLLFLPLCLVASVLSTAPWLRSFPASIAGAPLYAAALISVLVPLITVAIRPRWLWLGILVDVLVFTLYTLIVVLQDPTNISDLVHGLYQGPSQVLTFALPLISPRSLMVAPVALTWLAGALAGECIARRWYTLLPYVGFLVAFGLAYAGTQRAAGSDLSSARTRETLLAAGLLVTLMLMRVAQAWVRQDETAESTQPDGILPLRGLLVGTATTLVIAVAASLVVQTAAFPKRSDTPQRVPTINDSNPLTPMAFIAGLRPRNQKSTAKLLFTVNLDKASPGYFAIANVDLYDGAGWSFDRTFRPSGGILPADTDADLRPTQTITQEYRIVPGPLTSAPWMPFMYRAQKVTGTSVNIDAASGMIVPAGALHGGESYTVRSGISAKTFDQLDADRATPDTNTSATDIQIPGALRATLDRLITAFTEETGTPSTPALPFLRALQADLRTKYSLSGAAQGSSTGTPTPSSTAPTSTPKTTATSSPKATPKSTPKTKPKSTPHTTHRTRGERDRPLGAKSTPKTKSKTTPKSAHKSTPASTKKSTSPAAATPTATGSASPTNTSPASDLAGGTGFAEVLGSILGTSRSGTPEQFATLVALVARELGIPARVVTGFRVAPKSGPGQLPAGQYDVTTAEAWTWTEVPLAGAGWVVLDGSPGRFSPDDQPTQSGAAPSSSSSAPPSQNALVTQGRSGGHAVAPKSQVPATSSGQQDALLVALLIALGALLLAIALILASRKPARAARRRRSADPRTRLIGAWQESLDVLTEAGLPELTTMTSTEIAALTAEQFGEESGEQAASLGAAANAVAYSATTVVAPDEADAAWTRQRTLRKAVRRQLGVRERMAASVRYHRPKKTERPTSPPSWAAATAASRSAAVKATTPPRRKYRGRRRAH